MCVARSEKERRVEELWDFYLSKINYERIYEIESSVDEWVKISINREGNVLRKTNEVDEIFFCSIEKTNEIIHIFY